jgi:hypothetical protein
MTITVGRFNFEGPYTNTNLLRDNSGVYAVHCHRDNAYFLIDVGESATVKTRVENHDRKDCWAGNCAGALTVSVLYTPGQQQAGRMAIEQELRNQFNPPCGSK